MGISINRRPEGVEVLDAQKAPAAGDISSLLLQMQI